ATSLPLRSAHHCRCRWCSRGSLRRRTARGYFERNLSRIPDEDRRADGDPIGCINIGGATRIDSAGCGRFRSELEEPVCARVELHDTARASATFRHGSWLYREAWHTLVSRL